MKTTAKKQEICRIIRNNILSGRFPAGSRIPTTAQFAEQFSVASMTVHSALQELVRDGWLIRHHKRGTFVIDPAERKERPASSRIVMVLPVQEDIRSYGAFESVLKVLRGCIDGSSGCRAEFSLVSLSSVPDDKEIQSAVEKILTFHGAIFLGIQYLPIIEKLKQQKFHHVIVGTSIGDVSVSYDQFTAVRMGMKPLLSKGYRQISYFGNTENRFSKFESFRKILLEENLIPFSVEVCVKREDAAGAARQFFDRVELPEAIFVDHHGKSEILIHMAQERGIKIPEELEISSSGPSTAIIPYAEMGYEGATLLNQLIQGSVMPPVHRVLQPHLSSPESEVQKSSILNLMEVFT